MTVVEYNNYLMESYDFSQTSHIAKLGILFQLIQLFSQGSIFSLKFHFRNNLNDGEIVE